MDTKDIRLERLRAIINDRFGGVAGQCADALGMKRPQLSRWITANEAARQGISDDSARSIEKAFGYPRGWLDGLVSEDKESTSSKADVSTTDHRGVAEPSLGRYDPDINLTEEEKNLVLDYRMLTQESRDQIRQYLSVRSAIESLNEPDESPEEKGSSPPDYRQIDVNSHLKTLRLGIGTLEKSGKK